VTPVATTEPAPAKLNLALVVGPRRADGKHELATVFQRIDLCDRITLEPADRLRIGGFCDDTIVRTALERLAAAARVGPHWHVTIEKQIPIAAGLGGGSSDAATALRLANATLEQPLEPVELVALARELGADVPFFLCDGPQLGTGDGSDVAALELPQDYVVVVVAPGGVRKQSTAAVYSSFDEHRGEVGWEERRAALLDALGRVRRARDLALLPPNDLASSPLADELRGRGAFRADVSGAGPCVYGLFQEEREARAAAVALKARGQAWITVPAWYG